MQNKPILCLDFDGVCHSYISGWKGADIIPDPPVEGLFEFIEDAAKHFRIQIFSSRSNQPGGTEAMMAWFVDHRKKWRENGGQGKQIIELEFPKEKPPAFLTIDDRVVLFEGSWPRAIDLREFKPWNKR